MGAGYCHMNDLTVIQTAQVAMARSLIRTRYYYVGRAASVDLPIGMGACCRTLYHLGSIGLTVFQPFKFVWDNMAAPSIVLSIALPSHLLFCLL